jgi:hypothetical protein
VVQQLANRDRVPFLRHLGPQLPDRVVQREPAAVDQLERDCAGERLGDARDPHVVVEAKRPRRVGLGAAGGAVAGLLAALHEDPDPVGPVGHRDQRVHRALEALVGLLGSRERGAGEQERKRGRGDREQSPCSHQREIMDRSRSAA